MERITYEQLLSWIKEKAKSWPTPYVKRRDMEAFSFGWINADRLKKLDRRGEGPKGLFQPRGPLRKKLDWAYPIEEAIKWFERERDELRRAREKQLNRDRSRFPSLYNDLKDIRERAARWPTPYIKRRDVGRLTSYFITRKTLKELDRRGRGPTERWNTSRDVYYPLESFLSWLEAMVKEVEERKAKK